MFGVVWCSLVESLPRRSCAVCYKSKRDGDEVLKKEEMVLDILQQHVINRVNK